MADQEDFKFPDEKVEAAQDSADNFKVEVVDDTPAEDRNRAPLPKTIVEELEKDDLEEYSEKVQKRLSQMKKVWHDERREKERASREREEALTFAQRAYEENKQLKQRLGQGEKVFITEVTKAATMEAAQAKDSLKRAYEAGDAEQIAEAQEALTNAQLKLREFQQFKPSLQEDNFDVQHQAQQVPTVQQAHSDPKAESWREKNTWFGPNKRMTAYALGLHEELVESGADPRSDDYYRQVDTEMRRRFSDYFGEESPTTEDRDNKPAYRKTSTVVAPATRSTAPRSIRLSSSQAAIAKRLGLTPEAYARELIKLENSNG
jgi:hypothetical protein